MILQSRIKEHHIQEPHSNKLAYWKQLTERNDHCHVRVLIATYFADDERQLFFLKYERDHIHEGGTSPTFEERSIYNDVTTAMMVDIYRHFGEEVYNRVTKCL